MKRSLPGPIFAFVGAVLALSAAAQAATVTGFGYYAGYVAPYVNPFDPNLDFNVTASEATVTTDPAFSVSFAIQDAVSRRDNRGGGSAGLARLQRNGDATGPATFWQIQAATPFLARTIVVSQAVFGGFQAGTSMPYQVRMGLTPAATLVASPITVSGPPSPQAGTPGSHPIAVGLTGIKDPVDTLRVNFASTAVLTSTNTSFADMMEVVILPDRLARVPGTITNSSGGSGPGHAIDQDGEIVASGYFDTSATNNKFLEITLPSVKPIRGMVFYGWDAFAGQTFNIQDAQSGLSTVATVTGLGAEVLPIRFDRALFTNKVRITFPGTGMAGFREVVFLEALPEPASFMLLGAGATLLLWRRRV